jgi:hypothetical protein
MIQTAEAFFGKAVNAYTFLGIEFFEHDRPNLRIDCSRFATIQLPFKSYTSPYDAENECAHEVIHLMFHSPGVIPIALEEGVATYFQNYYLKEIYRSALNPAYIEYIEPFDLVSRLLVLDSDAIKKLRDEQFVLSLITKEQIIKLFPEYPEEDAEKLVKPFNYLENHADENGDERIQ